MATFIAYLSMKLLVFEIAYCDLLDRAIDAVIIH